MKRYPETVAKTLRASSLMLVWLMSGRFAVAAVVGPAGYTNGFSVRPAAADWATRSIAGSGTDAYDSNLEVAAITANGITTQSVLDSGNPPVANSLAVWSSTGGYLQTCPTQNRLTTLLGRFVNNTGSNATQVTLSYVHTIGSTSAPEDPGQGTRLYYSLTGLANSWINLPALNTTAWTNGSTSVATNLAVTWPNGGNLFLLWVDDNSGAGTDSANQLDNFSLRVSAGTPTNFFCMVTSPADGSATLAGTSILAFSLAGNGTPPYTVEYFTNSGAGNAMFTSAGTSSAAPFVRALGTLPLGVYNICAVVTDGAGLSTNSMTNVFAVVNPIAIELTSPLDGASVEHTTAVSGRVDVSGGTPPYFVQFYLDDAPHGPAVVAPPYEHSFGPLYVGAHAIRATVTDAKNWRSNSVVSTIQVTGPLAALLTPTNGSVLVYGNSLFLTAAVAGGTPPYAATLHVGGWPSVSFASPPFRTNFGVLPVGSYPCYVEASDSSVPMQRAYSSTNVITIHPPPLRIMPVGDSITLGVAVPGGYRAPLYRMLTNAGHTIDYIGTQMGNASPNLPDNAHEGYSGWHIRDIDNVILNSFAATPEPDIILLLIGVNDYLSGDDPAHATNRLEALIVKMAVARPRARIIVASLTVLSEPVNTQVQTTFNPFVPGLCARQQALGRKVYFTDMHSVVPLADLPDQLHPGQLGYNKMATNWFAAIQALLCTNCPPRLTLHPRSQSMLPGTNLTLEAVALGNGGPIRYQWRFEGAPIPDATNATYTVTNASIIRQGNYSVAATDANGTTVSSSAFLFLFVRPVFVLNPGPQTVLQGGTATFTAIATGAPPIWYRWQLNSGGLTTNNTGILVLTNVQANSTIRVAATNFATGPSGVFMTPSTGVTLTMLPDFDRDGMADAWETQHGLNTNDTTDAVLDLDGDGASNRAEYMAGTNPTDASSVLRLTVSPSHINRLEFTAQSNMAYAVQGRTNLLSSGWFNLTNIAAQPQMHTVLVHVPSTPLMWERYYRVVSPPAP